VRHGWVRKVNIRVCEVRVWGIIRMDIAPSAHNERPGDAGPVRNLVAAWGLTGRLFVRFQVSVFSFRDTGYEILDTCFGIRVSGIGHAIVSLPRSGCIPKPRVGAMRRSRCSRRTLGVGGKNPSHTPKALHGGIVVVPFRARVGGRMSFLLFVKPLRGIWLLCGSLPKVCFAALPRRDPGLWDVTPSA